MRRAGSGIRAGSWWDSAAAPQPGAAPRTDRTVGAAPSRPPSGPAPLRGRSARRPRTPDGLAQDAELIWMAQQQYDAVSDQIDRGLEARREKETGDGEQLGAGQLLTV